MTLPMLAQVGMELYFVVYILGIISLVLLSIVGKFISLWFQAFVSGTPIPLFNIIGMALRKIPPRIIVQARIMAFKAGLKQISVSDLETHFMAGGNVQKVVQAMIAAVGRGVPAGAALEAPRAIDVAPTILELLGVSAPAWMEGRALRFEEAPFPGA